MPLALSTIFVNTQLHPNHRNHHPTRQKNPRQSEFGDFVWDVDLSLGFARFRRPNLVRTNFRFFQLKIVGFCKKVSFELEIRSSISFELRQTQWELAWCTAGICEFHHEFHVHDKNASCGGDAGHVASSKRFLACRTIRQNFRHVCARHATSVRAQQDEGLKLKSKSLWPTLWQRRRARASQWSSQLVPHLQNKNLSLSSAHDGDLGHNRNAVGPLFRFTSVLHTCYRKCFFYWLTSFFLSCSTATRDWHAPLHAPSIFDKKLSRMMRQSNRVPRFIR